MEWVGKSVTKEFEGFGVFEGFIESYDSSSGFFKILYEDGDSEEADFSEVSRLISCSTVCNSIAENQKKKVGRKPKRPRNDQGKSSSDVDNLVIDNGLSNSEMSNFNVPVDLNVNVNVNGNLDCGGNDRFDLNRGLNFDDGVENGEIRGCFDLNLSVDDGGAAENDARVGKIEPLGKKEHVFDLNLGFNEETVIGGIGINDGNACGGLGEQFENVDSSNGDLNNRVFDVKLEGGGCEGVDSKQCGDSNSGRKKKRKFERNLCSPTETVLRRSARRAKAAALQENNVSSAMEEEEVNDLSESGVINEQEEKAVPKVFEKFVEPKGLLANTEFPPSSANLNLEGIPVLDLFSIYSCLRSFSTLLYLSPFGLEDLVTALKSKVSNHLIDCIHVSILQTLRKHLELLAIEGCESASTCLRNLNWDLLDVITWPVFMIEYLLIHGSGQKPGFTLNCLNLFDGEYYTQPAEVKVELLRCLCDDVIEVDAIRSELSKRTVLAEANTDRRRTSAETPGDSLSEDVIEVVDDGNIDECCLCKMDGNLICCDGCPAAYHSKCVGIVSSLLPEGDWYCPECVIGRQSFSNKAQKFFRGADLLGIDPAGRLFFSCFDYLVVSDSYDGKALCRFYHKDDFGGVIQLLQSSAFVYRSILRKISEHWALPADLCQQKSVLRSENDAAKPCLETQNLLTSSEGSGEVLQENVLIQKSLRSASNVATRGISGRSVPASKKGKKKGSSKQCESLKVKEEGLLDGQPGDGYKNSYSFARTAASVVEELLRKPTGKANIDVLKTEEEIISIQLKFILKKSTKSCWIIEDLNGGRQKEKCEWCYCCRFPVEGRGCLFSVKNTSSVSAALKEEIDSILSKRNKKGHLVDVICYLLGMEERLRGFLAGPWLKPQYSETWRQRVLKASDVLSLKIPLLMLESHLRSLALSAEWYKHVDLVTTMGSAHHFVASSRASSKNGINRKKVRYSESESKSSAAGKGLTLYWWRGGKASRSLFNWKGVPRFLALKAARKAGAMKIPDIQYLEASENVKRTRFVAWRAAVESSTSLEQLALQLREFDLFIRWDDIENTHSHSLLDKESIKSIRLFKKVIVRRKTLEGTLARYLLDFGKRRCIPDVVHKHGQKLEESDSERKKYWLDEVHVPLYLLRSFEERRLMRKAGKKVPGKSKKVGKVVKKPPREKGFDYLFSRAEKVDSYQCGHCNKNVAIGEAVSCQFCNGYFHKRHVMKATEGIAAGCTYTCHKCRAGKHVNTERNLRKRKFENLRETKNMKVDIKGNPARSRGRPKKKGILLANRRKVLLRNAKKMQCHEQTVSQKKTNISTGMTLRRSARKAKYTSPQPNKSAVGRKRKRNKSRTVSSKKTSDGILWQKKRTPILYSFWINGLFLSRKPNDERVVQFKRRKLIVPSEYAADMDDQPKCSLCSRQGSTSACVFIACEICEAWFHGAAFGLNKGNVGSLLGFKCHVCLERSPPVCPFVDISMDNHAPSGEATSEAQEAHELPKVSAVREDTDCVPELQSNDTVQNCDRNLHQNGTLIRDNNMGLEDGSPTRKEHDCNRDSTNETPDARGLHQAVAIIKDTDTYTVQELQCKKDSSSLLEVDTKNCETYHDGDETSMLNVELMENGSLPAKELHCDKGSTREFQNALGLPEVGFRKEAGCVQKLCKEGSSSLMEVHTAQNCDENLDGNGTRVLNFEPRVESSSFTCKGPQCNEGSTGEAQVQESPEVDCLRALQSNEVTNLLEVHTTQKCDGNLDQNESLIVENASPTSKEPPCNKGLCLSEDHTGEECDGSFDQGETKMLETGSPTNKALLSPSIEVQVTDIEPKLQESVVNGDIEGKNLDQNETPMVENASLTSKEPLCNKGLCLSEDHTGEDRDGSFDQGETKMLENGFPASKALLSGSSEIQATDSEPKLQEPLLAMKETR
ncbi:unnamed protein product [Amaranthus hypochondriacus]